MRYGYWDMPDRLLPVMLRFKKTNLLWSLSQSQRFMSNPVRRLGHARAVSG